MWGRGSELLTTGEMAACDRAAVAAGVPFLTLMENAGGAVADEAGKMVAPGATIAVLCGPGNNGGDGFVAARVLRERGYTVRVGCTVPVEALKGDAAEMARQWHGEVASLAMTPFAVGCYRAPVLMSEACDLVIDAILGAGLSRPLDASMRALVHSINAWHGVRGQDRRPLVLAVDVPTGLDGTTGTTPGCSPNFESIVRADRTVTFFTAKTGHSLLPGRTLLGRLVVADIGIPDELLQTTVSAMARRNTPDRWQASLPVLALATTAHKYTRGHAVVVSGPPHSTGAARLAARGALRVGAGVVTVASPQAAVAINAAQLTAIMVAPFQVPTGLSHVLRDTRKNAVLLGPGLGLGQDAAAMVKIALNSGAAVVLDADALTAFAGATGVLANAIAELQSKSREVVLTPHEGEFARLTGPLPGSKLDRARALAAATQAIVVLKGADTVIAHPNGRAVINDHAPPWLATAGSGDVLAGMITGLLAQGMPAIQAACAAVWMHGDAANRVGPGLIAEDLPEVLPAVLKSLYEAQERTQA